MSVRNPNKYNYVNLDVSTDQLERIKGCVRWDYSNTTIIQHFP